MLTLYYGWTAAELLTAMASAQEDLAKGKMLIQANSGDVQGGFQIQANAKERIMELQRALYELDPDTYPMFENAGHNQVHAIFSTSSC